MELSHCLPSTPVYLLPLWLSFGFLPMLLCTAMFAASRLLHCIVLKHNQLLEFGNLSYLPFDSYALSPSVQINIKINNVLSGIII